ncbi:MAG: LysR family transcriptional regulator [Gemmobacter sp.]
MHNWDELRTAWAVARQGTVSGAAEVLGVHHATVIRHIDALEQRLGVKLFQRHSRGYTPTEAGRDLFEVAEVAASAFGQLESRIRGQADDVSGDLVVTSVSGLAQLMVPALVAFQAAHPAVILRYLTDTRVFRLEYGEAHVAVRAGPAPHDPDYVVQPFGQLRTALYGSRTYVEAHGLPASPQDLDGQRFVGAEGEVRRAPFNRWMDSHVPDAAVVLRTSETDSLLAAVRAGAGLGFLSVHLAAEDPELVMALPPLPEWEAPLWLVTHVDLHRTAKVKAVVTHLKQAVKSWRHL